MLYVPTLVTTELSRGFTEPCPFAHYIIPPSINTTLVPFFHLGVQQGHMNSSSLVQLSANASVPRLGSPVQYEVSHSQSAPTLGRWNHVLSAPGSNRRLVYTSSIYIAEWNSLPCLNAVLLSPAPSTSAIWEVCPLRMVGRPSGAVSSDPIFYPVSLMRRKRCCTPMACEPWSTFGLLRRP